MKQTNIIELKIPDAMGDIDCVRRIQLPHCPDMYLRSDSNLVVIILVVVADQSRLEIRRWTAILVVVMLLLDERHAIFHFQTPTFF